MKHRRFLLVGIRYSFLFCATLWISSPAWAQKINVLPEARDIEGLKRKGMAVLVEFDKKTVEKAWTRQLKSLGKTDTWKSGAIVLLAPSATSPEYKDLDLISRLDATTEGTKIFLSLGSKGDYAEPGQPDYERAKKMLSDFCRQLYRDDLADQISAAEKVVDMASRTHDKTVQMSEQLRRQLERNLQDQATLLKNLEEKKTDAERLRQELTQNKADQEASLEEIRKVRKIAEDKKGKLTGGQ